MQSYLEKEEKPKAWDNILFVFSVSYTQIIWLQAAKSEER